MNTIDAVGTVKGQVTQIGVTYIWFDLDVPQRKGIDFRLDAGRGPILFQLRAAIQKLPIPLLGSNLVKMVPFCSGSRQGIRCPHLVYRTMIYGSRRDQHLPSAGFGSVRDKPSR